MEMKSDIIMSYIFLLLAVAVAVAVAVMMNVDAKDTNVYRCRKSSGNFTSPNYKNNIASALNEVVKKSIGAHNRFYHSTAGTEPETVTAVGLCAGYVTSVFCEMCLKGTTELLQKNCPKGKECVAWADKCMVRYSDRNIIGVLDDWVWVLLPEGPMMKNPGEVDNAVHSLPTKLQPQAAGGDSVKKYACGNFTCNPDPLAFRAVFAVMQCTPDISKEQCNKCLMSTILTVHPCCSGRFGARLLSPNCFLRYEHKDFTKDLK